MKSKNIGDDSQGYLGEAIQGFLKIVHYIGMACILMMMVMTTIHAVGRYLFRLPIPGLVEMSCYLLVAGIFLTVPYTALVRGHIEISVIVDTFNARTQAIIETISNILCLLIGILATWQTFIRFSYIAEEEQVSAVLSIPNAPFVFIVAIGWALFSVVFVWHLINSIHKAVK